MRPTEPGKIYRVAVLVDTSTGWGRRLIQGITNYAHKQGDWRLWVEPASRSDATHLPAAWRGDGVIARVVGTPMARRLRATRKPVVNVSGIRLPGFEFPRVTTNYRASAKLAAEHFIERGFAHFAYVGPFNLSYVVECRDAYAAVLAETGRTCEPYNYRPGASSRTAWQRGLTKLGEWLRQLPKPVAVLTWGTTTGVYVLEACSQQHLAVPDEVAVLGGDDDVLLCEAARPPLSGIQVASEQIGYTAAERLHRLMRGETLQKRSVTIDPIVVATRQSTDVLALGDPDLIHAVAYMRENACLPITVDDILQKVPVSRRSLERLFRQAFGRTPGEELRRLRMARCRDLLARTDLSIPEVAKSCGFATGEHLATLFKREHGVTPLKYRTRVRAR